MSHVLAQFEVAPKVLRDVAACFLDGIDDVRLVHHVPLPKRDELFEVVGEQLAADVEAERKEPRCQVADKGGRGALLTDRLTLVETTEPFMIGTTLVKLYPESMTSEQSDTVCLWSSTRPQGARKAA
jgi:hypothetical protein